MYGIIYLLTNTQTNLQYVGQTVQSLNARWNKHTADAYVGETPQIANAIRTYGVQAFTKQVLRIGVQTSAL